MPSGVLNSGHRAVCRMVPPSWMMPPTLLGVKWRKLSLIRPSQPRSKPMTCRPFEWAMRVTARMAAFMPGASPPVVITPMVFI